MTSQHDKIARRLARKFKTPYLLEGVDLKPKDTAIEVAASESDMYQSVKQLNRSRKAKKYMALPSPLISQAEKLLKGTGIGIMNDKGNVRKKARKKTK